MENRSSCIKVHNSTSYPALLNLADVGSFDYACPRLTNQNPSTRFFSSEQPAWRGKRVNNHNLHSTLAQSCKEDFMTKTNSKTEVWVRNRVLVTGVSKPSPSRFSPQRAVQSWGLRSLIHNLAVHELDHASSSRDEIMNAWSWISTPLCLLMARLLLRMCFCFAFATENYCYTSRLAQR